MGESGRRGRGAERRGSVVQDASGEGKVGEQREREGEGFYSSLHGRGVRADEEDRSLSLLCEEGTPHQRVPRQSGGEASNKGNPRAVKRVGLAAVEEKQTRRNQTNIPSPPSLSSPSDCGVEKVGAMGMVVAGQSRDVSPTVAAVEEDVSAEAKRRNEGRRGRKKERSSLSCTTPVH